jgi:hypothetical protein
MTSLFEVVQGLMIGKSFKRPLDGGGFEYVRPINDSMFTHTVAGENAYGGYGGQADLAIQVLSNGRWATHGWIPE